MAITIPKPNFADKFLRLIGKKRAVHLPKNMWKFGQHFHVVGIKENFFKALARPSKKRLPKDTVDVFLIENLKD